ncbi:MAG: YlbF family regulator [Verrucomicrobia bacterium]|nr:YlbF family regulator [Verrucomicrobiota bacterium]
MQATTEETAIIQQTKELCQTIIDQPEFRQIRTRIDAFMGDDAAKAQYQLVMEKGDELQQKQQMGAQLDNNDIAEFEKNRELLLNNPVAANFLTAQQQMHKIQESVMQYVSKTFELGRVPTIEDFPAEGCGPSCGCH